MLRLLRPPAPAITPLSQIILSALILSCPTLHFLSLSMERTPVTCSQGFGAAERIPPGGGIPVIEMEAELRVRWNGDEIGMEKNIMILLEMEL